MRMSIGATRWPAAMMAGAALLLGLIAALIEPGSAAAPIALAAAGSMAAVAVLLPQAANAVRRNRGLVLPLVLLAVVCLWVATGIDHADSVPGFSFYPPFHSGQPDPFVQFTYGMGSALNNNGWPWRLGRIALLPLALTVLSAALGLVLLSDAVRVQVGLAPSRWIPWRLMVEPVQRRTQIAGRAVPGALLIGGAAIAGIGLADRYASAHPLAEAIVSIVIGGWAVVLIASPLLIGALTLLDRDKAGLAREAERQRFAAHLHDSVLQTLALVQRQAHDPAAVTRLARRQEHALRAWMAGESELVSETLGAALRDVVANVEDEYGITIELTAIGDRPLDDKGEALAAAAREALRNAARHGVGAPIVVFCEIASSRVEVFIRDQGPGFDIDSVAPERRGLRDAVIGRMAAVGGRALVDSTPGEGTEIALELHAGVNGR